MNRKWKIAGAVAGSLVTLSLIVVLAALVAVRSGWFRDYVRRKIVSSVENSTGGLAALSAFAFDPRSMTATVTGFVLHGTEPPGSAPLFEAPRIVLTLRWFHLEYLGVERPRVNVIALAGGGTNIPSPKHRSTSGKPGLETFVNLAIRRLQI
ncbi:MAG: hypothetical protein LAO79_29210, partial [Acidobacteriia bacterium]|nr:hypothetical protein [Terriglobia bacterium]